MKKLMPSQVRVTIAADKAILRAIVRQVKQAKVKPKVVKAAKGSKEARMAKAKVKAASQPRQSGAPHAKSLDTYRRRAGSPPTSQEVQEAPGRGRRGR